MPRRLLCLSLSLALLAAAAFAAEDPLEKAADDPPATGLLITQVVDGYQASVVGLREGDVLTSYAGAATSSQQAFGAQILAHSQAKKVEVRFVRDRKERTATVGGGRLGIVMVPVEKGKAVPRQPATSFQPDMAALKTGETFHSFVMDGKKAGFERRKLEIGADGIRVDHLVRFNTGEINADLRMRMMLDRGLYLPVRSLDFTIGKQAPLRLERTRAGLSGSTATETLSLPLAKDTVPSWAVELVALTMPREVGACLHFSMLNEGEQRTASRFELVCAAKETVKAGGKDEPAFRYEARRFGAVTNRWWVTADHRLVRADYNGPVAELTTRQEALAGLPTGVSKEF